ncbi:MAG: mechanosensitive ion channel family protein [Planctomycetes bacterium]|nr:mechanosensitive ion channel family protein [Planctomycetota bacterium]
MRRLHALPVLVALALAAPAVRGQEMPPPEAPSASAPVPAGLASPRATMRTFLEGMAGASRGQREGLTRAAGCLDLAGVNETVRAQKGEELALQLKQVIDHLRFVVLDELPDSPQGEPFILHRDAAGGGAVVIDRRPDGRWLFSADTVRALPELVRALEHLDVVQGAVAIPFHLSPSLWLRQHVPMSLRQTGFLLEHWQWLGLLALTLTGLVCDKLLVALIALLARLWLRRKDVTIEPELLARGARPFGLLAMALVWRLGDVLLALPLQAHNVLVVALNFVVAAAGVWGAYRLIDVVAAGMAQRAARTETKFDDLLVPLVRKTAKVFVGAMGLVFVAETMELSISGLLAGVGLGGLAFALAAQDTVKNLFGSLTVVVDRPFQVGDWVVIDGGVEGTVEEVGFRSTRIRTFYDSLVSLPNALLLTCKVDNMGARRYRRWRTTLPITLDTPPDTVEAFCEGIRELVRQHPMTRKDYFQVWLNAYSPSSLDIMLYIFHQVPDWTSELRERQRLMLDILRLARAMNVKLARPVVDLQRTAGEPEPVASAATFTVSEIQAEGRAQARALLRAGGPREAPPTTRLSPLVDRGDGGE